MTKVEWVLSHPDDVIKRLDILLEEVGRLSGEEIDPQVFWEEMFSRTDKHVQWRKDEYDPNRKLPVIKTYTFDSL